MITQRYLKFRIFNRWWQEVYNGNDSWDSKWHGVVLEEGVYLSYTCSLPGWRS